MFAGFSAERRDVTGTFKIHLAAACKETEEEVQSGETSRRQEE